MNNIASSTDKLSRTQKKQQTRDALISSALQLVAAGQSFSSVSLREVTRQSGVVPTTFYRHFKDMNELGLTVVDEMGLVLRRQMREVRQMAVPQQYFMHRSVEIYMAYVQAHREMFTFLLRERFGGNQEMRVALGKELNFFAKELASDLQRQNLFSDISLDDLENISELVIDTVASATQIFLSLAHDDSERKQREIKRVEKQLRVIFLGAMQWKSTNPS